MTTQKTIQAFTLGLILVSGAAEAGLFSKKKPAPPPAPEPAPVVVPVAPPPPPPAPIPLEFSGIQTQAPLASLFDHVSKASPEVQATLQWVQASKDNGSLPFIVVDKANAKVYAFNSFAQLKATAPILLGMGIGDKVMVSPDAPMSAIPPEKRITPAGRYVSKLALEPSGKLILSIDALNLISMHIVAKGTPAQRRYERLASVTSSDNRVSFGCINVPPAFFKDVVAPDFRPAKGIVYILPEKTTAGQLFGFAPAAPAAPAPIAPIAGQAPVMTAAVSTAPATTTTTLDLTPVASPAAAAPDMMTTAATTTAPATTTLDLTPVASPAATDPLATPAPATAPVELPQAAPLATGGTAEVAAPGRD